MGNQIDSSLKKITKGSIIVFLGTGIGLGLTFLTKIIIARSVSQDIYGMYALLLAILEIITMIALLGLGPGAARFIAYLKEKREAENIKRVILICLKITLGAGLAFAFLFFFLASWISTSIFHEPQLTLPLKIFSLGIPFLVIINILSSIFRGFNQVKPKVYFLDILMRLLIILFISIVIFLGYSLVEIVLGRLLALIVTAISFTWYTHKKLSFFFSKRKIEEKKDSRLVKRLLSFSLPLLATTILATIMTKVDTLMIGYFRTPQEVGLYNGAIPLARLLQIILSSVGFIYLPILTGLWAKKLLPDIKRTYQVLTKWVFSAVFPVFLIFFIFPKHCLNLFFGVDFIPAFASLQIIAFGFLIHVLFGMNGLTTMVIGKTRINMWANIIAVLVNIALNIILIPKFGIVGAALASCTSLILRNVFISLRLYQLSKIQPFTKNFVKPVVLFFIATVPIYVYTRRIAINSWWVLPLFFVLFIMIYLVSLIITRSIDKEDIMIVKVFERRTSIKLNLVRKLLRRFI